MTNGRPDARHVDRDAERDLDYIRALTAAEDQALRTAGRDARAVAGRPSVSPEAGRTLQLLTAATGVRRALEIGAGAGYSGIWIARGLRSDGRLETIELSEENAQVCRKNYAAAGVGGRVEIRLGAALEVLPTLKGPYDLCFIDAVKAEYPGYLGHAMRLVRPGGLICADNVLWQGTVWDPRATDDAVEGVRAFNRRIASSPKLLSHILSLGDGLSVSLVLGG
jgi:predicted O-methyltransferase YrrM